MATIADSSSRDRNAAQAVLRACEVLKCFRSESEVVALPDVVGRTSLSRTTAFRLLKSLVQGGLLERVGRGEYRSLVRTRSSRIIRLGFAEQTNSEFSRSVTEGIQRAASAKENIQLVMVNNRYSAAEALRNAEYLIRENVDLVLEFQTHQRVATKIAARFQEANIPVIAIEIPHPGATYFGANNYEAGLIAGRALGRWTKQHWPGGAEQVLLLELPIAGPLPRLRITGTVDGLRSELPYFDSMSCVHLDGKGSFEQILGVVRKHLSRSRPRRTLVGAVNDPCALAALRAFEEAGCAQLCSVVGQNGTLAARQELRRRGTQLVGSVAYFPERYGEELIRMAIRLLENKPVPSAVFVAHKLLTPQNVDLLYPLDGTSPVELM